MHYFNAIFSHSSLCFFLIRPVSANRPIPVRKAKKTASIFPCSKPDIPYKYNRSYQSLFYFFSSIFFCLVLPAFSSHTSQEKIEYKPSYFPPRISQQLSFVFVTFLNAARQPLFSAGFGDPFLCLDCVFYDLWVDKP